MQAKLKRTPEPYLKNKLKRDLTKRNVKWESHSWHTLFIHTYGVLLKFSHYQAECQRITITHLPKEAVSLEFTPNGTIEHIYGKIARFKGTTDLFNSTNDTRIILSDSIKRRRKPNKQAQLSEFKKAS